MHLSLLLQDIPSGIIATIDRFTTFLVGYLTALAAVGALAMAAIEFAKKVFDWRTRFHARRLLGFITDTTAERNSKARALGVQGGSPPEAVLAELIQLGTGVNLDQASAAAAALVARGGRIPLWHAGHRNPAHALFALELERMMGALQESAEVALTTPRDHRHLYLLATSGANAGDVQGWYDRGSGVMRAVADPNAPDTARDEARALADQFTRLRQIMKRRLDAFQLYTSDSWASWNQLWANVVGAMTMFLVLLWMRGTDAANTPGMASTLILSLLGGVLSPVAKDLLNLLKRVKGG